MAIRADLSQVQEMKPGEPLPEGDYALQITAAVEGRTTNGDDKVVVDYVVYEGPFTGRSVKFHNVTFFRDMLNAKGASFTKGFLKAIGEPVDGDQEYHPETWVGKILVGHLIKGQPRDNGKVFNEVRWVKPYAIDYTKQTAEPTAASVEDVPF